MWPEGLQIVDCGSQPPCRLLQSSKIWQEVGRLRDVLAMPYPRQTGYNIGLRLSLNKARNTTLLTLEVLAMTECRSSFQHRNGITTKGELKEN